MRLTSRLLQAAAASSIAFPLAAQGVTEIVSRNPATGAAGQGASVTPEMSTDGRYVVFQSEADELLNGLVLNEYHIFFADRALGTLELIDHGASGAPANGGSVEPVVSADGRYVLFMSVAANLGGFGGATRDVFMYDRASNAYECLSSTPVDGRFRGHRARMSSDARLIALQLEDTTVPVTWQRNQVWLLDRVTGVRTLASADANGLVADEESLYPDVSDDGRYVSFQSDGTNLVTGDTNASTDVFVKDMSSGAIERVSVTSSGAEAIGRSRFPRMSADGRFVAFQSDGFPPAYSETLYVRDRQAGTTRAASVVGAGTVVYSSPEPCSISDDGRFVLFHSSENLLPGDSDGTAQDVFQRDMLLNVTSAVSVLTDDEPTPAYAQQGVISGDGRMLALVLSLQVYARDPSIGIAHSLCFGTFSACPCGNNGLPGHGCESSWGNGGGLLEWSGNASLSNDTLRLVARTLPDSTTLLYFQGTSALNGGLGVSFGDGLRCVGGTIVRLGVRTAVLGVSTLGPASGDPTLSALGAIHAFGTRSFYQAWFRDPDPAYCSGATYNLTNAVEMHWAP